MQVDAVIHHTQWGRDVALATYDYGEHTLHRVIPHGHWGARYAAYRGIDRATVEKNLVERMMGHALTVPGEIWLRLNLIWCLFFFSMGGLNLFVAYRFSEETWVNFKLFGMLGLTFAFIIGQAMYVARFVEQEETEGEG